MHHITYIIADLRFTWTKPSVFGSFFFCFGVSSSFFASYPFSWDNAGQSFFSGLSHHELRDPTKTFVRIVYNYYR